MVTVTKIYHFELLSAQTVHQKLVLERLMAV